MMFGYHASFGRHGRFGSTVWTPEVTNTLIEAGGGIATSIVQSIAENERDAASKSKSKKKKKKKLGTAKSNSASEAFLNRKNRQSAPAATEGATVPWGWMAAGTGLLLAVVILRRPPPRAPQAAYPHHPRR